MKKFKSIIVAILIICLNLSFPNEVLAGTSTTLIYRITDETFVKTGGLALGNPKGKNSKTQIYAVKATKDDADATFYNLPINSSKKEADTIHLDKSLKHANDMTYGYDPKTKKYKLFVASNSNNHIFKINPSNCSYQETYKTPKKSEEIDAIAYCPSLGKNYYILRNKNARTYQITTLSKKLFPAKKFFR